MGSRRKTFGLLPIALFLTLTLLIPSMTNAEITSYYSNNADINTVAFTLTIYSPENQNQTYSSAMPLNFTIFWTVYPSFSGLPSPPAPTLKTVYSYTIDSYPAVAVTSNQSSSDILGHGSGRTIVVNPTFSYSVNIASFAYGYHKIVITASLSFMSGRGYLEHLFSASSDPVYFLVQNTTPTPTPTPPPTSTPSKEPTSTPKPQQPEPFSTALVVASVVSAAVIGIGLLVYLKKRSHARINKRSEIEQSST